MVKKFPYRSILVACSVNTARSPMAEGFLKHFFEENGLDVNVCSGGISSNARDGMLISIDAQLAMKEVGIELSDTVMSQDLKKYPEIMEGADLILTLTERHKKEISRFEEVKGKKILTLKEFAGDYGDIEDPSMKELKGFRVARDEILKCLKKGLSKYGMTCE